MSKFTKAERRAVYNRLMADWYPKSFEKARPEDIDKFCDTFHGGLIILRMRFSKLWKAGKTGFKKGYKKGVKK